MIADGPDALKVTGVARMAEAWRAYLHTWDGYRIEADEFRELDTERVLVLSHYGGRGRTSGLELGQMRTEAAQVFHVRDGKVTAFVGYNDRARGLADLGLASQGDSP